MTNGLRESWFTNQKLGLSLWVEVLNPGHGTIRVLWLQAVLSVRTPTKSLHPKFKTQHHSTVGSTQVLECLTQKNKQDRNTIPTSSRQAAHRYPKTYHTQPCPSTGKNSLPLTRLQAQAPPNAKLTQATGPTSPTKGETGSKSYDPIAWG